MKKTSLMKKTVSLALSVFLTLSVLLTIPFGALTVSAAEDVKGWADSADGVYYIATPQDLLAFKNDAEVAKDKNAKVYLTADIDMTGVSWYPVNTINCLLDGNGHTIKGLSYTHTAGSGHGAFVFTLVGTIKNVRFVDGSFNTTVAGTSVSRFGGVVGQTYSTDASAKATLENVYAEFTVNAEGKEAIGGFIGRALNPADLINCVSECTVIGGQAVGGFVGQVQGGPVQFVNCVSKSQVTASTIAAGFVGRLFTGSANFDSCADGSAVSLKNGSGAGFLGDTKLATTTNLTDCLSYGTYTGASMCSGMIGYARGTATLTRCVGMGTATTTNDGATSLVSLRSENAESYTPAKNALDSDPNADISAYVKKITLVDCYFNNTANALAVYRHPNRYFRCIDLSVTYSDGNNTDLSSERNGYCDASLPGYADYTAASKPFSDAVRTIDTADLKISDYELLVNWVQTPNGLLAPADVADLMEICPIPSDLYYQVSTAENADGTKNVRFIAVINDLDYANVGFHVQVTRTNGSVTETSAVIDRQMTTVYSSVLAAGETVTAEELNGKYIVAVVLNNIDYANFEHTFKISAYVTKNDANRTVLETDSTIVTLAQKAGA